MEKHLRAEFLWKGLDRAPLPCGVGRLCRQLWPRSVTTHNVRLRSCWVGSQRGEVTPCHGGCCPRVLLADYLSRTSRRRAGTTRPCCVCSWHTAHQEGQHRLLSPRELLGGSSPSPWQVTHGSCVRRGHPAHLPWGCRGRWQMLPGVTSGSHFAPPAARLLPVPGSAPGCANTLHLVCWGPEATAAGCR